MFVVHDDFIAAQLSSLQLLACDTNFYGDIRGVLPHTGLTGASTSTAPTSNWVNWTLPAAPRDVALQSVCSRLRDPSRHQTNMRIVRLMFSEASRR